MAESKTEIVIIGSGPAGYTAAIYVARSGVKPLLITGFQTGGQLTQTTEIENFPGFPEPIYGGELMDRMSRQCINLGVNIVVDHVKSADFKNPPFKLETESGNTYLADSIIIATGASAKKANIPGEERFFGYGVSACATCDGFFSRDKDVAVIGGGNAAVIEALHLSTLAKSVTIIHRRDELRAEKVMIDRVLSNPKIKVEWDSSVEEIYGAEMPAYVKGVKIKNIKTEKIKDIAVDGVFVAIGHKPNTDVFKDQIKLNEAGYIVVEKPATQTSIKGIFAAGDVIDPRYKQAITAAANGCEAGLDAVAYLHSITK
ncbi:MAG: thioredoxin-disulfide reductase [Lactobacillaceae bacterium]|jgi:thioredoxin reductase (NADPH)|nr:thioredoxin-disulfide reductase [Lactobacillaceae bacterium]